MKTLCSSCFFLFLAILICAACKKDSCPDIEISKIEPSSNPPGYEIRLSGTGFTSNSVVRFINSESTNTKLVDASTLIATVPSGVLGPVEITVKDGDCLARNDRFEVFADFPSNIPFSPNTIIIPQVATNYPTNFQNFWPNLNDPNHAVFLENIGDPDGILGNDSKEFHNNAGSPLNGNKITGRFKVNQSLQTTDIYITINRIGQNEPENYIGTLIDPASVGSVEPFVLLLTSEKDGRQLVFEYPN